MSLAGTEACDIFHRSVPLCFSIAEVYSGQMAKLKVGHDNGGV